MRVTVLERRRSPLCDPRSVPEPVPPMNRCATGTLCLLALAALGGGTWAAADPGPAPRPVGPAEEVDACFVAVTKAWAKRDAEAVVAQCAADEKANLSLVLLGDPPVKGSFTKPQARQTLKAYFETLRGAPTLTDVTPPESKRALPGTRIYDYGYRREGGDPVTTRLEVGLKQVSGRWTLASVSERLRPRTAGAAPP